ncbi:uncharacterized protein HD556DRAFT_1438753 [Suillus plorans]|uniref:Uncharacterized protein n=1 Tax=Suillus plorans TaxID=116603 RepID=A0A9P7DQK7_9AGAM|nr:uncharacterized protein HD556DRAFT_1438753 [Suillus plorans]KAG1800751.1 hypothetical protein HD556DRAFT_1438753 [Suillus plorans]
MPMNLVSTLTIKCWLQGVSELALILKSETAAAPQKVSRMYYQNFDTNITARYHVIIENWPLVKFCAPSDISSRNELSVLKCAWESNATQFRRLTDTEFELWEEDWFQAALALQNETPVEDTQPSESSPKPPLNLSLVTTNTTYPDNTIPQPDTNTCPSDANIHSSDANTRPSDVSTHSFGASQPHRCKHKAPSTEVLNTVFSGSGDSIPIQKKVRKERSDKGKARGPRKKATTKAMQESAAVVNNSSTPDINSPPSTAAHVMGTASAE